ncbi:Protein FAR1-RELATED SEQUENCE 6 [Bienertia sinuspersici]
MDWLRLTFFLSDRYVHLKEELMNVIYNSFTMEEFQSEWLLVIKEYDLQSSEWLNEMYEEREMWVPAYTKNFFWAGMQTTHRVESTHIFFDECVAKHTRLCEFAKKYCVVMEKWARMERDEDVNSALFVRGLETGFKVEAVFQKRYTNAKFLKVRRECTRVLYCTGRGETWVSNTEVEHLMEDRLWVFCEARKTELPSTIRRLYRVRFNTETSEVSCDCKLFESCGIMCRHSIKVYDMNLVEDVPEKYILRRWRKDIPRKHTRVKVAYHDPSKTVEVMTYEMEETMEIVINMVKVLNLSVDKRLGKISTSNVGECRTMDIPQTIPSARTLKYVDNAVNLPLPAEAAFATKTIRDPLLNRKCNRPVHSIITGKSLLKSNQLVSEACIFKHHRDDDDDEDGVNCSRVIKLRPSAITHGECQGQRQEPTSLESKQFVGEGEPTGYVTRNMTKGR